jgi:hypothetical protein
MSSRQALRRFKYALAPALESLWRPLIAAISRRRGVAADRWASNGGQRVLVIAPHPDDEAIGCVGTLLRHVEAGDQVCVAIATDGRRSRAVSDPDHMARLRRAESTHGRAHACRADRVVRLRPKAAGASRSCRRCAACRLKLRPDVIYAPSRVDFFIPNTSRWRIRWRWR